MGKRRVMKPVGYLLPEEEIKRFRFPTGVAKANIRKQLKPGKQTQRVRYYYKNVEFECRDCGKKQVSTVAQQRQFYEEQGGKADAVAVKCRACRKKPSQQAK